jgi:shikimate dehydrogenase
MFGRQQGIDIDYEAVDIGRNGFPARLQAFADSGGAGCNITLPLKDEACRLATHHGPAAMPSRAANTLVAGEDGWSAHNTDGRGLCTDLERHMDLVGKSVLVLGAGGAAAGVMGDLLEAGVGSLALSNRSRARAEALSERYKEVGEIGVVEWEAVPAQHMPDLLINATSLGHSAKSPPLPGGGNRAGTLVYDLNYGPAARPLREDCQEAGLAFADGLGMLVEQAALAFDLWTGRVPETRPVLEVLGAESVPGQGLS